MTCRKPPLLEARNIGFAYPGGKTVLDNVSLQLKKGDILGIVGPNGVGKSTVVKTLSGYLRPSRGEVTFDGVPIRKMKPLERARRLAVVPQNVYAPVPFTVRQVVGMGRLVRLPRFSALAVADHLAVEAALTAFELDGLSDRPFATLSGGERQLTLIAAAVAQAPEALLLDEPTAHLDIGHCARVVQTLLKWRRDTQVALSLVTHDVQMAARVCDWIILIKDGKALAEGPPETVLTATNLRQAYGRGVVALDNPWGRIPIILPELDITESVTIK